MKRLRLLTSLILGLVLVLSISGTVMADDPTEVTITWGGGTFDGGGYPVDSGSGYIGATVAAGDDAVSTFSTAGNAILGQYKAKDDNINHYNYGVNSCVFSLDAAVFDGGFIELFVDRTDAKTSYGNPGQQSYSYVNTTDGDATLTNRSSTNYASMKDCNFGFQANNHITVTGSSSYTLERYMYSGATNLVDLAAWGIGSADLTCMNAEASQGMVRLGNGCGCYTNAKFNATGSGVFNLEAYADTEVTSALAPGITGMTSFNFIAAWSSGINIPDYHTQAD